MRNIYFISGVNGVGKSSLIPYLRNLLPENKYSVVDFDSRGVPDGADHSWRIAEAHHWIAEGIRAIELGKEFIVCGFVKPQDFADTDTGANIHIIVLDAEADTIRTRLMGRYTKDGVFDENQEVIGKPVRDFIDGNVWYAQTMREDSHKDGLPVIDTSHLTSEEVASKVVALIQDT